MAIEPFFIEYIYKNDHEIAEVKPCCEEEEDVFYYDIYNRNQYQFTITPTANNQNEFCWRISLKNADKNIDQELIDMIGQEIEKRLLL